MKNSKQNIDLTIPISILNNIKEESINSGISIGNVLKNALLKQNENNNINFSKNTLTKCTISIDSETAALYESFMSNIFEQLLGAKNVNKEKEAK